MLKACRADIFSLMAPFEKSDCATMTAVLERLTSLLGVAVQNMSKANTDELIAKLQNFGAALTASPTLVELSKERVQVAEKNNRHRSAILQVLLQFRKMVAYGLPSTPEAAIDQWIARGEESCLSLCIGMLWSVKALASLPEFDFSTINYDDGTELQLPSLFEEAAVLLEAEVDSPSAANILMKEVLRFKDTVVSLPILNFARDLVIDSAQTLVKKFTLLAELPAFISDFAEEVEQPASLAVISARFVSKQALASSVIAVAKILAAGEKHLPSVSANKMLRSLIEVGGVDKVRISEELVKGPSADIKCELLLAVFEVYEKMHHVAACLAWIGSACEGVAGCAMNHVLRKDLEAALGILDLNISAGEEAVASHRVEFAEGLLDMQLHLDVEACSKWLAGVRRAFPGLCRLVLLSLFAAIQQLTKLVVSHTIPYEHFISDTTCSLKLLRSRVLHFSAKDVLTGETVTLFNSLAALARFRKTYGLAVEPGEEDEFSEQVSEATTAFQASKKLMFVHSATQCLLEMSGDEQFKEATAWVGNKANKIPKGLVAELQKVCKKRLSSTERATDDKTK
ncbi:unnamed protein product [Polarella glacialis]|uniref:Uncharacterized protein n=1 Tax=Polarella glacialis TaxID=89957 RepID=A0A813G2B0_POLGL|nr:unnamed protein product [Polarella glacialis]